MHHCCLLVFRGGGGGWVEGEERQKCGFLPFCHPGKGAGGDDAAVLSFLSFHLWVGGMAAVYLACSCTGLGGGERKAVRPDTCPFPMEDQV